MQVLAEKSPQIATIPLCKNGQNTTTTRNSGEIYLFSVSGAYGARYLDPRTSRWISVDPAVGDYIPQAPANDDARKHNQNLPGMGGVYNPVNLHVYHYAGNNPVKYTDPDGRDDEPLNPAYVADPDAPKYHPAIVDRIKKIADNNLDQEYGPGNTCDEFVENVLKKAGVDPSNYLAGSAGSTTVQEHIDNATKSGRTSPIDKTAEGVDLIPGAYVVFMNDSKQNYDPHSGILIVNKDGKMDFYHSSSSESGLSRKEGGYSNTKSFQKDFAYSKFYYQQIK